MPGRMGSPSKWPSNQRLCGDTRNHEEPDDGADGPGIGIRSVSSGGINAASIYGASLALDAVPDV